MKPLIKQTRLPALDKAGTILRGEGTEYRGRLDYSNQLIAPTPPPPRSPRVLLLSKEESVYLAHPLQNKTGKKRVKSGSTGSQNFHYFY